MPDIYEWKKATIVLELAPRSERIAVESVVLVSSASSRLQQFVRSFRILARIKMNGMVE